MNPEKSMRKALMVAKSVAATAAPLRDYKKGGRTKLATGGVPEEEVPTFYSALDQGIAGAKQMQAPAQDWPNIIGKMPGVTKDEMETRGLHDFLGQQSGMVHRDAITNHLKQNPFGLNEVWKQSAEKPANDGRFVSETPFGHAVYGDEGQQESEVYYNTETDALAALHRKQTEGNTKYGEYQLPLGKNYKELLLTLPAKTAKQHFISYRNGPTVGSGYPSREAAEKEFGELFPHRDDMEIREGRGDSATTTKTPENYKSTHWDEPNVLAHVRMNDRRGPNGEKLLHIEEIQSDWHQEGRESGYKGSSKPDGWTAKEGPGDPASGPVWEVRDNNGRWVLGVPRENATTQEAAIRRAADNRSGAVPNAPFKDTKAWTELALKKVIRHAADNGYDGITWTPGDIQADRYDLSHHVASIKWYDGRGDDERYPGFKSLWATNHAGKRVFDVPHVPDEDLSKHVGKDVAKKMLALEPDDQGFRTLKGDDLKVGGEGMRDYYDKIVPSVANKIGKEHGVKAGHINVASDKDPEGPFRVMTPMEGASDPKWHLSNDAGDIVHTADNEPEIRAKHKEMEDSDGRVRVHYMKITPSMKRKAMRQFKRGGAINPKVDAALKVASRVIKKVA